MAFPIFLIILILWVSIPTYCFVCIWIPEVRLLHWWGSRVKLGALSHASLTWFFGSPLLIATGVVSPTFSTPLYVSLLLSLLVLALGYQVDKTLQKRND
jgi:hypothetical protein